MLPAVSRAPSPLARVGRLAEISRFAAETYARTRLVERRLASPRETGAWIADRSAAMGPLFVKLSQLVSARADVMDPELVAALSTVQDRVRCPGIVRPAVPGYSVDPAAEPLKAGSVASVWLATRDADGQPAVIKQLHAGVRASFERDLPTIIGVLRLAAALNVPGAANFCEIVCESEAMLYEETDLRREAAHMAAYRARAPAGVVVPAVLEAGDDFLVQEYVPSLKITDVDGPCRPLARQLMVVFVLSLLGVGLVHADGHPGNLGVHPDGAIVVYDWGACVDVSDLRDSLASLFQALAARNLEGFVEAMQSLGIIEASPAEAYRVVRVLRKLARTPADEFHVSLSQQPEFADSAGNRLVRFRTDMVYLLRALSLVEGVCRSLDPDFSYKAYWELDLRRIVADYVDQARDEDPGEALRSLLAWAQGVRGMPDTHQRALDAAHELNATIREEMADLRRQVALASVGGAALLLPLLLPP